MMWWTVVLILHLATKFIEVLFGTEVTLQFALHPVADFDGGFSKKYQMGSDFLPDMMLIHASQKLQNPLFISYYQLLVGKSPMRQFQEIFLAKIPHVIILGNIPSQNSQGQYRNPNRPLMSILLEILKFFEYFMHWSNTLDVLN